jgi:TRAP-type mannitol/chloroaromatic compound transport system permease small subunit
MRAILFISRMIDAVNEVVGRAVGWLILVAVLISSGNAAVRYIFDESSNGWLEAQWYLFSAVFLLCAGYTLLRNEHIRIDIITGRCGPRAKAWIDILGGLFFLLPAAVLIMVLSWPMFMDSYLRHEMSSDAGGLIRWPAKLLVPVGFLLLVLQAISELIKRVAFLTGHAPAPAPRSSHAPLDSIEAEEHAA